MIARTLNHQISGFTALPIITLAIIGLAMGCNAIPESARVEVATPNPPTEPLERFGLLWEAFDSDSGVIASGQSLSHILSPAGMSAGEIARLTQATNDEYDVRNMRSGNPCGLHTTETHQQQLHTSFTSVTPENTLVFHFKNHTQWHWKAFLQTL